MTWNSQKIAKACGVSDRFVDSVRAVVSPNASEMPRLVERGGVVFGQAPKRPPALLANPNWPQRSLAVALATEPEPAEESEPESERRPAPVVRRDPEPDARPVPEQPKVSALVEQHTREFLGWLSALRPHEIAYVKAAVKGA